MLFVETDIGRDPDDLFALIYLIESGINIGGITITPGDPDQVAIVRFLNSYYGADIPIGVADESRNKSSSGGVHYKLLNKYKFPKTAKADGLGCDIIASEYMQCDDLLIIGPCTNVGAWITKYNPIINKATMQGGFLPCDMEKFKGMENCPTFNLNGDRNAGQIFLNYPIAERRMVGKNVCHGIVMKKEHGELMKGLAGELAELYFDGHKEKKFHDPLAAVLHYSPFIGEWVKGKTVKAGSGWTTDLNRPEDYILKSIDEEAFWDFIWLEGME